jgi:hypothetical protein
MSRPQDWQDVLDIDDPTPGEVSTVRQVGRTWERIGDDAEYAESRLRGLMGDAAVVSWIGKAGNTFREHSSELPDQLRKCKESYHQAADAMSWWANQLGSHQTDAGRALQDGREAKADLEAAQQQLDAAADVLSAAAGAGALHLHNVPDDLKPSSDDITKARNKLDSAERAKGNAQALVDNAQARLDAARRLALDAGDLRKQDGRTAADKVRDAADAGIKPRSRWQKIKDGAKAAWDVLVEVAKIVVAVLGIVVLIIGGPLAWVVLAAALIVLADTLMKYAKGEASLLDVGLAALSCIPGTKGLTTLKELTAAFKAGGMLGAASHLTVAVKGMVVNLAATANALRRNFLPGMQKIAQVFGEGGASSFASLRTSLKTISATFMEARSGGSTMAESAQAWQGTRPFAGVDDYADTMLDAGRQLEAGWPGLSNYAVDGGTAASHGNDAGQVWEGVQVGPGAADGAHPGYRDSMVTLHVNSPTPAASGTTLANPQFGPGGETQYFLDIKDGIASGNITVLDHGGSPIHIPDGTPANQVEVIVSNALGGPGPIQLSGAHSPNYTHVMSQENIKSTDSVSLILQGTGYASAGAGAR